jgi:hypothetical protein
MNKLRVTTFALCILFLFQIDKGSISTITGANQWSCNHFFNSNFFADDRIFFEFIGMDVFFDWKVVFGWAQILTER